MSRRSWVLVVLALFVALVAATWPLMNPSILLTHAVGHPYGDMPDHYWGTWWFGGELLAGRWPGTTNLSHFPQALSLWYVDPLGALLALPLRPLGFPLGWNLLMLGQLGLTTAAAFWVGRDVGGTVGTGLVAAMIAGPSPYALGLLHSGLSEYIGMAPVVLYCWALMRTMELDPRGRPAPTRGIALCGGLLALCGLQALYYLVFGALLACCAVLGRGWRKRLRVLVRIGVVSAVLSAPVLALSLSTLLGEGAITGDSAPGWSGRLPATDVLSFVHPGNYYFPDTPAHRNPGILHVNYLGWVALAATAVALVGRRLNGGGRPLGAYALLALGPRLAFLEKIVMVGGTSVLLPLGLLYFPGSPIRMVHQPYRMVAFLLPLVAMAAAVGVARLPRGGQLIVAALVLVETLVVSPAPWPVASRTIDPPAVYAALDAGPILDWPPDATSRNRDYLVWQVSHGQAVPYGVNVFLDEDLRRDPLVNRLLRALDDVQMRAANRDVPFQGQVHVAADEGDTQLAELGFAHVVVHKAALTDREWGRTRNLLQQAFGAPTYDDKQSSAWVVPAP